MRWKTAALLTMALLAVGCSSNSKKEPGPAELPDIKPEVKLDQAWSRSIGKGQGDTYNLLAPVVYGEQIFAADVEGLVVSMDRLTGKVVWKKDLDVAIPRCGGRRAALARQGEQRSAGAACGQRGSGAGADPGRPSGRAGNRRWQASLEL
jgi:outer membrane protein assembly factor BamB